MDNNVLNDFDLASFLNLTLKDQFDRIVPTRDNLIPKDGMGTPEEPSKQILSELKEMTFNEKGDPISYDKVLGYFFQASRMGSTEDIKTAIIASKKLTLSQAQKFTFYKYASNGWKNAIEVYRRRNGKDSLTTDLKPKAYLDNYIESQKLIQQLEPNIKPINTK